MHSVALDDVFSQLEATQNQFILALSAFYDACTQLYETATKMQIKDETYSALDDRLVQMDKQLASLSGTEQELAQSLSFLKQARNISKTMIPINRLPAELLAPIFELVVSPQDHTGAAEERTQPNPLATIPSVCHSWRQLALCTPRLWTCIDLTGYNHDSTLNRAMLWSQRAREVPVHLYLARLRFFEDQELEPELRNISTRAASFNISPLSDEAYIRDLFSHYNLLGGSDTLKAITMGPTSGWPELSSHFDWSHFVPDTLTSLKLTHTLENITPSLDELISLLSRTRNLHTLILRDASVSPGPRTSYPEIHLPHLEYLESYPHRSTRMNYSGITKRLIQSIMPGSNDIEAWLEMGEPDDEEHDSAMHKFFTRSRITRLHTGHFKPKDHLLLARYLDCLPELRFLSLDFDSKPTNNVLDALVTTSVEGQEHSARCPKLQGLRLSEACITPRSQAQLKRVVETHELTRLIFGERTYFVNEPGSPHGDREIMDWLYERVDDVESNDLSWFSLGA